MHERIKELRKALHFTQQQFAERIGLKRNSIAQIESGDRSPSNSVVNNICKTFHVSEAWLRTGEGEMYIPRARDNEIAAFLGDLANDDDSTFRKRFVAALSRLEERDWEAIEKFVGSMR